MSKTIDTGQEKKTLRLHNGRRGDDITGNQYRMLTALYPTEKRDRNGSVIWHCRCACGNEIDIAYEDLKFSQIVSCGCQKRERDKLLGTLPERAAGTVVNAIRNPRAYSNSSTGVRGVYSAKNRFGAEITFQKRTYRLGTYSTKQEAIDARKNAEKQLYEPFMEAYNKWAAKNKEDPEWGKANPLSVQVTPVGRGVFDIEIEPEL